MQKSVANRFFDASGGIVGAGGTSGFNNGAAGTFGGNGGAAGANTGSGGGGAQLDIYNGGSGGSGIVILRYLT